MKGEIVIYKTDDGNSEVKVTLHDETVWLSLKQMTDLFDKAKSTISFHITNIFKEGELDKNSTVRYFRTVQKEGKREIEREIEFFNLDVIISVGYRVKSRRGTQFRIWANKILKEHLINGYTLNKKLLERQSDKLYRLQDTIAIISRLSYSESITSKDKESFFAILDKYSAALNILDDYDYNRIRKIELPPRGAYRLEYSEAMDIIESMREKLGVSDLFGKEKDESLKSSLSAIFQTFDGVDLYPSIEEKASNLLYFLVKNHSFIDGNKRIAAALLL